MRLFLFGCVAAAIAMSSPALSQSREKIGTGRIFTNDYLGDNKDRWRTGSYAISVARASGWGGELPSAFGDLIEYRLRSDIIAPENIVTAAPGDRRYVGALSFGMHTHFEKAATEFSVGADLVITGPQTGLGELQSSIHDVMGASIPGVLGNQIPNGFHPTLTLEAGRSINIAPRFSFRPFLEVRAGVETLARAGGDFHFGLLGSDELMVRDVTTGHLYRTTKGEHLGFAAVFGADIAHVEHSTYLPGSSGFELTDARTRVRAGVHWQGEKSSVFYGLTYLGEEFKAQSEGQVVGSVRLNIRF
jgi:hypothetical protein